MKKSVVSALTAALVVGAASTTFAAANPFSDVPAGHWAYNSVTTLASEGVIEGYGDGTFLGNRNITRYEMAQMIAKAMAKNPQGASKAELDKLAAEFRDELDSLGVRVAELEKHADMVQWTGKIEYTYHSTRFKPDHAKSEKTNTDGYVFRLEPKAEINDHWTANARLDAEGNMKHDTDTSGHNNHVRLKRAWAQGDYDKFQIKLGKFEFYTNETGLIWDDELSGIQLSYGDKLKGTIYAGRMESDDVGGSSAYLGREIYANGLGRTTAVEKLSGGDPSTVIGINIQYDDAEKDRGVFGGMGYYYVKDDDLIFQKKTFEEKKATIWSANIGYKFGRKAKLWGSYARNNKADLEKTSWQAEFDYGTYNNASEKGQWSAWIGYRKFGSNVSLAGTTSDDALYGTKGLILGASWAPFKNIGLIAKYFNGKTITGDVDAEKLFGRVEFFF